MRKFWVAFAAAIVAAGLGVGIAWAAAGATTGTNVACATATAVTPARTISVSGMGGLTPTIAGASQTASHCVTQTYKVPTVATTVTSPPVTTTVTKTSTSTPTSTTSTSSTLSSTSSTASTTSSSTTTSSTTTVAAGCNLNATTGTFAAQFAAATSGQTVCLASGSYGNFAGAAKSGRVTIEPAAGAKVDMTVAFDGASNITVTGITLDNATLQGATHDVTLSNSIVPASGQIVVMIDQMTASSDIVIDHDTLDNQNCNPAGLEGRIDVEDAGANNSNPVGLTISNNTLSGGSADGVRLDAGSGIKVTGNTFTQFDDQDPCHTDDIQFYGSAVNAVIDGNFFYSQQNTADCSVSGFNTVDHMTFENNVVAGTANASCGGFGGGDGSIAVYGDTGSIIEHNVLAPTGTCVDGPCDVDLSFATPNISGSGTVIRDNIMSGITNQDGGTTFSQDHNLCTDANCTAQGDEGTGAGDIGNSMPKFVGGANPTTWAGFALAAGSPGIGAASDGTNMGIELPTGG